MPTILRTNGFDFFFYSNERNEPPHVHIELGDRSAKLWLEPVKLARNDGFRPHELTRIIAIVRANRDLFLERWHGHFGTGGG